MPDWDEDSPRLRANLGSLLRSLRDDARARPRPSAGDVRGWHRQMMAGLNPPNPNWVGVYRGEPGAEQIQVQVDLHPGLSADEVAPALNRFFKVLCELFDKMDRQIPPGTAPDSADRLEAVLEICAWVHAEWVRIHPFANGNGRTARLWANYVAMRYGLPPFVRLRPRPDGGYGRAASRAMKDNWEATIDVFRRLLADILE